MRVLTLASALLVFACADRPGRVPDDSVNPIPVVPVDVPVIVPDVQFTDVYGRPGRLSEFSSGKAIVVVMRDLECPVSRKYSPRIAAFEQEFAARGVAFVFVDASAADSAVALQSDAVQYGFAGPYVRDSTADFARALGATSTAEVFVLSPALQLKYRGAIDEQFGIGFTRPNEGTTYLRDALESVLDGRDVAVRSTSASGCMLGASHDHAADAALAITYHNRVSSVIQSNCQGCHRSGSVTTFTLDSYAQVYSHRETIARSVRTGSMPPWFAHPNVGEWANDARMPAQDKDDLLSWIADGAPEGDSAAAPVPRTWVDGWNIEEPDTVLQLPAPQPVPASGVLDYRYVYMKTNFSEDKWIQAMEIRPTASSVVHRVLVFIEEPVADQRAAGITRPVQQVGLQGYFAAHAPGQYGITYPRGTARRLPKGATLKFQIQYSPNGTAALDQTMLGLVFADQPPDYAITTSAATDIRFVIPPGASNHQVVATLLIPRDVTLLSFFPYMHMRGKTFRYDIIYPDGREVQLLDVPRFDFRFQLQYTMKHPLLVPAGSRIRATATFDNSSANSRNPDPGREVRFGEQLFEEMMVGYFDWYSPVR